MPRARASADRIGLPAARLNEIHDCLTLALDVSEKPRGYTLQERETRGYLRSALRHTVKLQERQV